MRVIKEANAGSAGGVTEEAMLLINGWSKKELSSEDVFVFDLRLCDNDVDRDNERFSKEAIQELAKLFVGKTGIFDHQWSAAGQKARIFKTEVVEEKGRGTAAGEEYAYLKASAYMLREGNDVLISEIEGGIKREVSVGCSMGSAVCSICGEERGSAKCGHTAGAQYGGRTCYFTLEKAADAYEWSFVAVPAQKEAGVMKKFDEDMKFATLEELIAKKAESGMREEFERLKEKAALGESYMASLKQEVVRLGVLSKSGFEADFLKSAAEKLSEEELLSFKKAFELRINELFPPVCQLSAGRDGEENFSGEEFLI